MALSLLFLRGTCVAVLLGGVGEASLGSALFLGFHMLLRWRCAGSEDFAIFNAVKRTAFGDLLVKLIESCTKQISLAGQAIFKLFYRAGRSQ